MPRWVLRAVVIFWLGFLATLVVRFMFSRLHTLILLVVVSLFLSLAIEPGVNFLARRGWRRGVATFAFLFGVLIVSLLFVGAIGALIGRQVANFIDDLPARITQVQSFVNRNFRTDLDFDELIARIDKGQLAGSLANNTITFTTAVLGGLLQVLTILLLTFYMVADGPRMRRSICGRLRPDRQQRVLHAWEVAIDKTGGYLYSRALLALLSATFHTVGLLGRRPRLPARAGHLGRPRVPVPPRDRDLPGRGAARARRAARRPHPRPVGARHHRDVPADRELPVRAPHHRSHAGAASGRGLLGRHRGGRPPRPGGRHPGLAGVRHRPGLPGRVGATSRRDRLAPHRARSAASTPPDSRGRSGPGPDSEAEQADDASG